MAQIRPLRFSLRQLLLSVAVLGVVLALWRAWPTISDGLWPPTDAAGFHDRAERRAHRGELKGAISDLDEAIKLEPRSDRHYRERGDDYFSQGETAKAIADYATAIRLSHGEPASVYALNDYATALATIGRYRDAIKVCTEAVQLKPAITVEQAVAFENRGASLMESGELDNAIRDLSQALKLAPDEAGFYFNRGLAYFRKGERGLADGDLARARELDRRFNGSNYAGQRRE